MLDTTIYKQTQITSIRHELTKHSHSIFYIKYILFFQITSSNKDSQRKLGQMVVLISDPEPTDRIEVEDGQLIL